MVVVDIATEENEASAHSVDHAGELLELGIGGVGFFAKPNVADSDIQWVFVADAAWNCFIHNGTIIEPGTLHKVVVLQEPSAPTGYHRSGRA